MTITNTTTKVEYVGDNVTTTFAIPFPFLAAGDIEVFLRDETTVPPTVTLQVAPTNYSVVATDVEFVTAPGSGVLVLVRRILAITQPTDYQNNSEFPAETHETALDRRTMVSQQLQEQIDRSITVPETLTGFDGTLPDPVGNANEFLRINATEDGLELASGTTVGVFTDVQNSTAAVGAQPTANFAEGISATENGGANRIDIALDIPNLTSEPVVAAGDELAIEDISAAAPRQRKATRNELLSGHIASLTSESVVDGADEIVVRDDSAASPQERRMTRSDFLAGFGGAQTVPIEVVSDGVSPPPIRDFNNDLPRIEFPQGADTDVRFTLPLEEYSAGDHLKIIIKGYAEATGNLVMESISSLYTPSSTDASAAPTNQRTNSQTIAAPATPNQFFTDTSIEISSNIGEINAVAVAAIDIITVNLKREGTNVSDTVAGSFFITDIIVDLAG